MTSIQQAVPVRGRGHFRISGSRARFLASVILVQAVLLLGSRSAAGAVGGYFGASVGNANTTFDSGHMHFGQKDLSADQTAWRLFAGSQLHKYVAVEAGYIHFGSPRAHTEPDVHFFKVKLTGFDAFAVGTLPVPGGFSAFAKGGVVFWKSDMTRDTILVPTGPESATGHNLAFGIGARYDIMRYLAVRAEYTRYAIKKTDSGLGDGNFFAVSGLFVLGR